MKAEEYKNQKTLLINEHNAKLRTLDIMYATSNNPYRIGDIATDHIGSIKIEKMLVHHGFGSDHPSMLYRGVELKKDGEPKKGNKIRDAYQSNLTLCTSE